MFRNVSTLLIPLLLLSQSVACAAGIHSGSAPGNSSDTAVRPHIHLGGGHDHHHGHHHDEQKKHRDSDHLKPVADHDGDAWYTSDSQPLNKQDANPAHLFALLPVMSHLVPTMGASTPADSSLRVFPSPHDGPIYLRTLSIRC